MRAAALALLLLAASGALAQEAAPDLRPQARPGADAPATGPAEEPAPTRPQARPEALAPTPPAPPSVLDRPRARPGPRPALAHGAETRPQRRAEQNLFAFSPLALAETQRPVQRPEAITRRAVERRLAIARGQLCGDPAIQGEAIGAVPGAGSCGIDSAVRVRSVAGVTLQPAATVDCRTASALKAWVAQSVKPAVSETLQQSVRSLRVVAHYSCRNRVGSGSRRLSEHAFGRAIDIAGIGLGNGTELTVLTDWGQGAKGTALRRMWRGACGPFGTVLGPEANAAHRDHFHFDTARYRSGSYCR